MRLGINISFLGNFFKTDESFLYHHGINIVRYESFLYHHGVRKLYIE